MERLTKPAVNHTGAEYVSALGSGRGVWRRIIQRLAEYENTGLEPAEIVAMEKDGQGLTANKRAYCATPSPHLYLNKCLNIIPLQHIQLENMLHLGGGLDSPYKLTCSIFANVMDTTDRVIVDACIEYAKAAGISDLYLLDREFVKAALLEKAERMKNAGRCCKYCGQRLEE